MVAMERPNRFLADVTVSAKALADKCTDSNIATVWVRDRIVLSIEVVVDVLGFYMPPIAIRSFGDGTSVLSLIQKTREAWDQIHVPWFAR